MRRTWVVYLAHAVVHPSNLLLLIGVMFLSLILWNTLVLGVGLGVEGALLCFVPRCGAFRRRVDESLDEAARASAQKARESLILQMGDGHRQELARIEALALKTLCNLQRQPHSTGRSTSRDDELGVERLTASYIRIAIAHKACEESLAMTNHHTLEATIRALEAAEVSSSERSRPLVRRRLAIAHRRAECWGRTREKLEALGHQLATILELVHLMHQESSAPLEAQQACVEIDGFLTEFEENEAALRELACISGDDAEGRESAAFNGLYCARRV